MSNCSAHEILLWPIPYQHAAGPSAQTRTLKPVQQVNPLARIAASSKQQHSN
jgi:hypothetical protein